jgi:hypothetical protein
MYKTESMKSARPPDGKTYKTINKKVAKNIFLNPNCPICIPASIIAR